jgi:transposase
MYTDIAQWAEIREMVLKKKTSRRQASKDTGISRSTIAKILKHKFPLGYTCLKPRRFQKLAPHIQHIKTLLQESELLPSSGKLTAKYIFDKLHGEHGYEGSYSTIRDFLSKNWSSRQNLWGDIYDVLISLSKSDSIIFLHLLSRADPPVVSQRKAAIFFKTYSKNFDKKKKPDKGVPARQMAHDWMLSVLQGAKTYESIACDVGEIKSIEQLLKQLYEGRLANRNRALCVLAEAKGIPRAWIYTFLKIHKATGRKYLEAYKLGGVDALYSRRRTILKKADNEDTKKIIFSTLHEPPSLHGINRTTWKWDDLIPVLKQKGVVVGKEIVRQVTKKAGFKWRKARVVLTSNDPEYREKLLRVQDILRNLKTGEAFFSIDEYGPFAVKMKGGRKLVGQGENYTVPQWQKSKGFLIMTAALELSTNQVTHFYSKKRTRMK